MFRRLSCIALVAAVLAGSARADDMKQAVAVHFQYGSTDLGRLFALEDQLEHAIAEAKAGEYDGNEVAVDGSDGYLYMYGPDADRLFEVVLPVLTSSEFMKGAEVKRRYGSPDDKAAREAVVVLGKD